MSDIKIFISCNRESYVPQHPLLYPIQTGAANADCHFEGMLHDDEGEDQISQRNTTYCELTAQYWVWKHMDADYYGFMHNRRYISFSQERFEEDEYGNVMMGMIDAAALDKLGYQPDNMRRMIEGNDIVALAPLDISKCTWLPKDQRTVRGQYASGQQHDTGDLDLLVSILREKYPDYAQDAVNYLNGDKGYYLNMYIMRKEHFNAYSAWLFDVLDAFSAKQDYTNFSNYEIRKCGFIAERLFGIYFTHLLRTRPDLKVRYLQNSFFSSLDKPYLEPAFDEHNVPVVMASSNEYVPFLGVLLSSIIANASGENNYDIIVLSNGISPTNRQILETVLEKRPNFALRFIEVSQILSNSDLPSKHHISVTTHARYMLTEFLPNYHKVLYLDSDIVVDVDIAELYHTDIEDYMVGAVRDTVVAGWYKMPGHPQKQYMDTVLKMRDPFNYFNAGVLLMNLDAMRARFSAKDLLDLACDDKWMWLDQDVLNSICDGRVKWLSQEWNVMAHADLNPYAKPEGFAPKWLQDAYNKAKEKPKLIHYAGRAIPCYAPDADLYWIFWRYARQTQFYEQLLFFLAQEAGELQKRKEQQQALLSRQNKLLYRFLRSVKRGIMPVINWLLPQHSARRDKVVWVYRRMRGIPEDGYQI